LKTPAFRFDVDGKYFGTIAFRKRLNGENHVISQPEFSSNLISKWRVIIAFSNRSSACHRDYSKRNRSPRNAFLDVTDVCQYRKIQARLAPRQYPHTVNFSQAKSLPNLTSNIFQTEIPFDSESHTLKNNIKPTKYKPQAC